MRGESAGVAGHSRGPEAAGAGGAARAGAGGRRSRRGCGQPRPVEGQRTRARAAERGPAPRRRRLPPPSPSSHWREERAAKGWRARADDEREGGREGGKERPEAKRARRPASRRRPHNNAQYVRRRAARAPCAAPKAAWRAARPAARKRRALLHHNLTHTHTHMHTERVGAPAAPGRTASAPRLTRRGHPTTASVRVPHGAWARERNARVLARPCRAKRGGRAPRATPRHAAKGRRPPPGDLNLPRAGGHPWHTARQGLARIAAGRPATCAAAPHPHPDVSAPGGGARDGGLESRAAPAAGAAHL